MNLLRRNGTSTSWQCKNNLLGHLIRTLLISIVFKKEKKFFSLVHVLQCLNPPKQTGNDIEVLANWTNTGNSTIKLMPNCLPPLPPCFPVSAQLGFPAQSTVPRWCPQLNATVQMHVLPVSPVWETLWHPVMNKSITSLLVPIGPCFSLGSSRQCSVYTSWGLGTWFD